MGECWQLTRTTAGVAARGKNFGGRAGAGRGRMSTTRRDNWMGLPRRTWYHLNYVEPHFTCAASLYRYDRCSSADTAGRCEINGQSLNASSHKSPPCAAVFSCFLNKNEAAEPAGHIQAKKVARPTRRRRPSTLDPLPSRRNPSQVGSLAAALAARRCTRYLYSTSNLKASNSCCSDPSFVCQSVVSMDSVLSLGAAEQQHQYEYEYMDMKYM